MHPSPNEEQQSDTLPPLARDIYKRLKPAAGNSTAQYTLLAAATQRNGRTFRAIPSYGLLKLAYGRAPTVLEVALCEGFHATRTLADTVPGQDHDDACRLLLDKGLCLELVINRQRYIAALGDYLPRHDISWLKGLKQRCRAELLLTWHKLKTTGKTPRPTRIS